MASNTSSASSVSSSSYASESSRPTNFTIGLEPLTAISPLDGRYWQKLNSLSAYFSEFSLVRYRVQVEIEYFIALVELPLPQLKEFSKEKIERMRSWYVDFSLNDAGKIKNIEKITNHDVKALEYWLKEKFVEEGMDVKHTEFIHFGLTSQDINNTAIPLGLMESIHTVYLPNLQLVIDTLAKLAVEWLGVPMLARTHGQVATPTRVGKEIMVFVERLKIQVKALKEVQVTAKFGGATGNFNAHYVAYPEINWISFANNFTEKLGLMREQYTTQISHYDSTAALCDNLRRINIILIDFCRDIWTYVSMDYFKQRVSNEEVGSSAMPHKVNPIDFENAEGNMGIANALFDHMASKLPISRLQRDLTDSTVLRNLGVPFGHTILSFNSIARGLSKLNINKDQIYRDLDDNWAIVAEGIQTVLRREGYSKPYEALKKLTRTGQKITRQSIVEFIDTLENISDAVKEELKQITPFSYIGVVPTPK